MCLRKESFSRSSVNPTSLPLPPHLTASSSAPPPLVSFSPFASPTPPSQQLRPVKRFPWLCLQLQTHRSTSACHPVGYALAPPSLGSTRNHYPVGFTRLPRPTVSTLIRCRPVCNFGSVWFRLPPGSVSVFSLPGSTLDARYHGSTYVSSSRSVTWPLRLVSSTSPSPTAPSPSVVPRVSSAQFPPWLLPSSTMPWGLVLAGPGPTSYQIR